MTDQHCRPVAIRPPLRDETALGAEEKLVAIREGLRPLVSDVVVEHAVRVLQISRSQFDRDENPRYPSHATSIASVQRVQVVNLPQAEQ